MRCIDAPVNAAPLLTGVQSDRQTALQLESPALNSFLHDSSEVLDR